MRRLVLMLVLAVVFGFWSNLALAVSPGNFGTGLELWLKANTGTSTTTDGGSVSSWTDQSTNATNASSSGSAQPTFYSGTHANAFNFNPVLLFDGTTDYMTHDDSFLPTQSEPRTIFVIGSFNSSPSAGTDVLYSYGNDSSNTKFTMDTDSSSNLRLFGTTLSATGGTFTAGIPFLGIGRFFSNSDASLDFNGFPGTLDSSSSIATTVTTYDAFIGATSGSSATNFLAGKMSELIIYNSDLSSTDKSKVQSYLALKYGLTLQGLRGRQAIEEFFGTPSAITAPSFGFNFGQSFIPTSSGSIESLILKGIITSPPVSGNLYFCTGAVTASACESSPENSTAFTISTAQSGEYEITLTTPFAVTAGTTYSFSFENNGPGTLSFYIDQTNSYANGQKYNGGSAAATEDIFFRIRGSSQTSSTTTDYIASDETVVWDADLNTSYNNDIAGIGQDDDSGLDQVKSKSQNSDGVMILSGAVSQDNLDFLVTGNNDGSATFSTTSSPSGYGNLSRVWLAQETGSIGTVTVAFDVADTGFDIPTQSTYYLVTDSDVDGSLSDETPVLLFDDGTNGDETAADNIYSRSGIDLDQGEIFTITTPYVPFSGTVYSDQGVTNIGSGMTVRLLKNGVDTGLTDDTDSSGFYEININGTGIVADDILTVFMDGETNDGVTVTRAIGESTHTGIDIYKDYLIIRSETATAISNNDLDTAHNGDTDFTTIYSNGGTTTFTGSSNKNVLINSGDNWTPGGTTTINGAFWDYGTLTGSTDSITVGGNFYVDNAATFSHSGTLTLSGGSATTFNQGDDAILSNVSVSNNASLGVKVTTNPANFASLSILASGRLYLGGQNLTITGAFSNSGTMMLYGNETITGLTQDTDSGTWNYVGNPNSSVDTYTITDWGATDYFNLTIGNTSVPTDTTDVFEQNSTLTLGAAYTLSRGIYNTQNFNLTTGTTFSASSGSLTFNAGSSNITVGTSFTFSGSSSGVNVFNAGSGTISIGTSFSQTGTSPVTTTFNAGSGPINVGTTFSVSGTGVTFNGSTGAIDIGSTFTVNTAGTTFVAPSSTLTVGTTFAHTNGTFTSNGGTVILDPNTNHTISGIATSFHNLTLLDTNDNATDVQLTVPSSIVLTYTGALTLDGLDSDDRVNLISSSVGVVGTTTFSGSGYFSGDYVDIKDNTATDSSTAEVLPINPVNGVDSGNNTGWFGDGVTVEFSGATAASTDENTADNFPTLLVSGTLSSSSTIEVAVTGGTATGTGTDYTFATLTVTIPAGTYDGTTATDITITAPTLVQDALVEGDETITFILQNAGANVTILDANADTTTQSTHTYTITDDESTVKVEFSSATAASTNETTANNLPVLLVDGTLASSVTVDVDVTGGTATSGGVDYTFTDPLTVTIPAGTYDGTVGTAISFTAPTLVQDLIVEGAETIIWTLNNAVGITIGDANSNAATQSTHTYTITDDDTLLVEFTSTTASAGEATASPTVTLTVGGAIITSSVTIEVADLGTGTATSGGTDYTFVTPRTVTIPAADYTTASTVTIGGLTIVDDASLEGNETINYTLQNASGVTIGDADGNAATESSQTFTITDNEVSAVTVELSASTASSTNESTADNFPTLLVNGMLSSASTIQLAVTGGTATGSGTDYTFATLTITIPAGTYDGTSATDITITAPTLVQDSTVEGNETITFTLQTAGTDVTIGDADSSATTQTTHTYTITDDDVLLVEFSSSAPSAGEATASPTWTLTVGGATITSSVTIEVADLGTGTATSGGVDYTFVTPRTITIPAANYTTASTVTIGGITLIDDAISESGGETINFTLQSASGVTIGDANGNATTVSTAAFTITDNDSPAVTVVELGGSSAITEGGATDTYTIALATTPSASVSITLTPDADCTVSPVGPLTFTTTTAQTVTITAVDDVLIEGSHTCTITHAATSADTDYNGISISTVVATVTDNDSATYTVTPTIASVTEGGAGDTFTVVLDVMPTTDVVFSVSIDDPTSATVSTATLTFTSLNWNVAQTVTISPVADLDLVYETDTVTIAVVDASSDDIYDAALNQTVTVSVTDDDDDDNDGVSNTEEDAGFNGGDGDGDGTLDRFQQDVSGASNPVTGEYTTVKAAGSCVFIRENEVLDEASLGTQDSTASYPVGLVDFRVDCPLAGDSSTITLYYTETYSTSSWIYKKYDSGTGAFADISGLVTFGTATVGLFTVTTATFTVTDGSATTDEDGVADASINDPSGPAIAVTTTTSSGGGGGGGASKPPRVCRDPAATNYSSVAKRPVGISDPKVCKYPVVEEEEAIVPEADPIVTPEPSPTLEVADHAKLIDLLGGGEPNVPPEFSDYVCERYLRSYILPDQANDPYEVVKLQEFLNDYEGEHLMVDGSYDEDDVAAINRFQTKYADQILAPWGIEAPTGRVYRTTAAKINIMMCSVQKGCPYFSSYLKEGEESLEAVKVQDFINIIFAPVSGYPNDGIPLSTTFGPRTKAGVMEFQRVYKEVVLKPWELDEPTGRWYITTRHAANLLMDCKEPPVVLDNGVVVGQ